MTAHFLIDAVRRARTPVTPFRQSMGDLVENFFRPSESVTDVGSFDSVRLTPHSAHDDSTFFDGRNSTGEDARHSIPAKHGGPGGKFLQAIGVRDKRGVVRLPSADASVRSR